MNISHVRFATTIPNTAVLAPYDIVLKRALTEDVFKTLADRYMNGQSIRIHALTKDKQNATLEYTCENRAERYKIVTVEEIAQLPNSLLATAIKLPSRMNPKILISVDLKALLELKSMLELKAKSMSPSTERQTVWDNVRKVNAHIFKCVNIFNHKLINKSMRWDERNNFYTTVMEDLMRHTNIKVFSPQETDNYNIPAKLKFEDSFNNE